MWTRFWPFLTPSPPRVDKFGHSWHLFLMSTWTWWTFVNPPPPLILSTWLLNDPYGWVGRSKTAKKIEYHMWMAPHFVKSPMGLASSDDVFCHKTDEAMACITLQRLVDDISISKWTKRELLNPIEMVKRCHKTRVLSREWCAFCPFFAFFNRVIKIWAGI